MGKLSYKHTFGQQIILRIIPHKKDKVAIWRSQLSYV